MENLNAILSIAISHVIKFTFPISRKYFFNDITPGKYYIVEIKLLLLTTPFFKKNIETKHCWKFVKAHYFL